LGQSQRRAGQIEAARASYQRFIELAPQHPSLGEARTYIRELDSIAAQVQRAEQDYRKQLNRTRGELLQQLNQTRDELLSERAQVAALRRDPPLYRRPWFWGVVGGTLGAVLITSVIVAYVATRAPEPPSTDTGYIGFSF
jgi:arsenate reductase-like glutaredoxin family protein